MSILGYLNFILQIYEDMLWNEYNQNKIIRHFIDKYVTNFHRIYKLLFFLNLSKII